MSRTFFNSLPVDRFGPDTSMWPGVIASFPNLVVELESHAARAVTMLPKISQSPPGDGLLDAGASFQMNLREVSSGYAIRKDEAAKRKARVEFDFPLHHGFIRLWDIRRSEAENLTTLMASLFSEKQLSLPALQKVRSIESLPRPRCPCCEKKAEERVRYTSMHPLFDILMSSTRKNDLLQLRVLSPFADLSVSLLPYRIEAENGVISATDKENTSAFFLDVRWLHAMKIKQVKLDGGFYSMLVGYDSFGAEIFHLASPNPGEAGERMRCCEWAQQFFTR